MRRYFWGARITTTIVYSKNIHVSQCDGTATIFHLCLILTTILCRNNIHFVYYQRPWYLIVQEKHPSMCSNKIHPFMLLNQPSNYIKSSISIRFQRLVRLKLGQVRLRQRRRGLCDCLFDVPAKYVPSFCWEFVIVRLRQPPLTSSEVHLSPSHMELSKVI